MPAVVSGIWRKVCRSMMRFSIRCFPNEATLIFRASCRLFASWGLKSSSGRHPRHACRVTAWSVPNRRQHSVFRSLLLLVTVTLRSLVCTFRSSSGIGGANAPASLSCLCRVASSLGVWFLCSLGSYLMLSDYTSRLCRQGEAHISREVASNLDRLGTSAQGVGPADSAAVGKAAVAGQLIAFPIASPERPDCRHRLA